MISARGAGSPARGGELAVGGAIYGLPRGGKAPPLHGIFMTTRFKLFAAGCGGLALGLGLTQPALRAAGAAAPVAATTPTTTAMDAAKGGGDAAAVKMLRDIVAKQRAALAEAAKMSADEAEDVRPKLQKVANAYEDLVKAHPDFAAAWAAYGLFLCEPVVEERKTALALLFKANGLDAELPVVKNQIGVLLAEDGRMIEALNYFLAASDLAPREPLYHFQIGLVLDEARDVFVKTNAWTPATIDKTVLEAFHRAVELAPERTDYAYRAAEAYYSLAEPRWEEALKVWSALEEKLTGNVERQAVRLHLARVQWKVGHAAAARELAGSVDAPVLKGTKEKMLAEFDSEDAAEAAAKAATKAAEVPTSAK
jgi:tetratricopeptide (TPR) repeat protein